MSFEQWFKFSLAGGICISAGVLLFIGWVIIKILQHFGVI